MLIDNNHLVATERGIVNGLVNGGFIIVANVVHCSFLVRSEGFVFNSMGIHLLLCCLLVHRGRLLDVESLRMVESTTRMVALA